MNICDLFSTKERVKILGNIIYSTEPLRVNKVAEEARLSKGLISKYFDILAKNNVLEKTDSGFLVKKNIYVKALRILLNLCSINTGLFKKYMFVKGAGIYGSFVKGTNTEKSDIDMWIFISKTNDEKMANLSKKLKEMGNVKPLYLTREKLERLKKNDEIFYHSLVFGSITIYGEEIEKI